MHLALLCLALLLLARILLWHSSCAIHIAEVCVYASWYVPARRTARVGNTERGMHSRARDCPGALPQLLPAAASAWLIAVAVALAVVGLVRPCCSCVGVVPVLGDGAGAGVGVGVLAVVTGAGAGAGLQAEQHPGKQKVLSPTELL
jgi:hypothetical protein